MEKIKTVGKAKSVVIKAEENDKAITRQIYFNEGLIALLFITLVYHGLGVLHLFSFSSLAGQISNISIVVVSILGIAPVVWSAVRALVKKSITIDLLASIALAFTIIQGEWVSAVFINLMLSSARLFEAFTERRTEHIISSLLKLRPVSVRVQDGEYTKEKTLEEVVVGDVVVVESGDRIPIDGSVVKGQAMVDESSLTGESKPLSKTPGSQVLSSTLCLSGSLFVRAEKVGEDTTLSKMIALVDEASRAKTKTETLANKFSAWYILISLVGVFVIYIVTRNLNLVLSILLVTCADDLAVAIPLGFTVAISKAAKHGIIVKGAAVMERLKDIRIFVTDKTGTLTKGVFAVSKAVSVDGRPENEFVIAGAICSIDSKHPMSKAVVQYAEKNGVKVHSPDEVMEYPGDGVYAKHGGHEYLHGRVSFLEQKGVMISHEVTKQISEEKQNGASITAVAIDGKLAGFFVLADEVKKYAHDAIAETKTLGVKDWIMLTGDNEQVASRVARETGINEFYANLKPAEKLEHIKKLKRKHGAIAMMGDGVNDAASLALADVSFSMGGTGADASIEASDITLIHDDLRRVPESIYLSKEVLSIVRQNFVIWAITNGVGLFLAFGGFVGPVGASVFNFLTDFLPIFNVFKIYNLKINKHTYDSVK
ncbi:MAG: cation-translocating P-type ATPase [bacterium]